MVALNRNGDPNYLAVTIAWAATSEVIDPQGGLLSLGRDTTLIEHNMMWSLS
jgi:hypothetical protein